MNTAVPSNMRSRGLAISGIVVGLVATAVYFTPTGAGMLGLPLSLLGSGLGVAALLFRPRAVWLGALALIVSSPALAFVLVSLALGIRC
jgi:hypothetical protein